MATLTISYHRAFAGPEPQTAMSWPSPESTPIQMTNGSPVRDCQNVCHEKTCFVLGNSVGVIDTHIGGIAFHGARELLHIAPASILLRPPGITEGGARPFESD